MHWIIQHNYHWDEGTKNLLAFLEKMQLSHSIHKVIPFVGELEPDIDIADGRAIVIGSYSMRHVAKRKGWVPGSFDLADITVADHIEHWGDHMLNADAVTCRFEQALGIMAGRDRDRFFVRPTVDSKFFAGGVFHVDDWHVWHDQVVNLGEDDGSTLKPETEVIVASVKTIQREYRNYVVDGKVVTSSMYKIGDRVHYSSEVDQDIIDFAQARVDEWQPRRAFVIDVALTDDGLRIVETNTLNAAGFYAADVSKLAMAIEDMAF